MARTYADKDEYDPDEAERLRCERCGTEYVSPRERCGECYVGGVVTDDDDVTVGDVFVTVFASVERGDRVLVTFDTGAEVTGRVIRLDHAKSVERNPGSWGIGHRAMTLHSLATHGIDLPFSELRVFVVEHRGDYTPWVDATSVCDPPIPGGACGVEPSVVGVEIFEKQGDR